MKVTVRTELVQVLEVPGTWDREDVFNFLAECQSFREAFEGVSNEDQTARIVDVQVLDETVTELGEVESWSKVNIEKILKQKEEAVEYLKKLKKYAIKNI